MTRKAFLALGGLLLLVALTVVPALAHAHYVSSDPAAGATVTAAPSQVKVVFGEEPSTTKSTLMVTDASGAQVDAGDGKVDTSDPDRKTMVVSLKSGLKDGIYTVKYHTLTEADGGIVDGLFRFGVNAPVPAAQAKEEKESGGDEAAADTTAAPSGGTGPGKLPNTGAADLPSPLPMLLGGLLLLGGGLVLRNRWAAQLKS